MDDHFRDLFVRGQAAAKAGDEKEARFFLEWLISQDPPLEFKMDAWRCMVQISHDPQEKRKYLEEILSNNLGDAFARREIAILNGEMRVEDQVDPEKIIRYAAPPAAEKASADRFVCPQCGARMVYTPDGASLYCEHCTSRETIATDTNISELKENNFIVSLATGQGHQRPVTMRTLTCQGCGAVFLLAAEAITRTCPYCDTPYAIHQIMSKEVIAPVGVIPFQLDEKAARQALSKWYHTDPIEPQPRFSRGKGIYIPAWTFDVGGTISWSCQIYVNKTWKTRNGQNIILYDDLLIPASHCLPDKTTPVFQSYQMDGLQAYDSRYLANWNAETYQITAADASLEARKNALKLERAKIEAEIWEQHTEIGINTSNMLVEAFKLILLPIWWSQYQVEDKRYSVVINGQNGQVFAERPQSTIMQFLDRIF